MIYGESDVERGLFQAIYFDYDSSVVKPREFSKVQAVATYMKANTGKKLLVEGHCDERGTAEYNRALGERRAQSARAELVRLGIPAERISTISYGKDRPVEPSHDETSWSKNRRCEFVIVR
jgi:peptidoglycan-associated lipoprotein